MALAAKSADHAHQSLYIGNTETTGKYRRVTLSSANKLEGLHDMLAIRDLKGKWRLGIFFVSRKILGNFWRLKKSKRVSVPIIRLHQTD